MDASPLIVPAQMNIDEAAVLAMQREDENIYDHLVVTDEQGIFIGIVPVHAILSRLASLEKDRAKELSAGNRVLEPV
ncbi:hypothetical protein DSCO28_24190 [Desulfosarcina ovata subsp. sediminis]|uniref:CBS domain-containing protein n=2 Tax=Desulfosarcina ovata TaxID=83564 RepID=A0A5K7ZRJ6_9BACT|nr:hypothetical protein DSCO28_24190 [Desulfosarcina ovata subsp. sediminis]